MSVPEQDEESASNRGARRIRTVVVDDSPRVLQLLCSLLETQATIEVVGKASDGLSALELAAVLKPDLVLMDLQMPGIDGLETTRRLLSQHPHIRVLVVTGHDGPDMRAASQAAGAHGFVSKNRLHSELAAEIHRLFASS